MIEIVKSDADGTYRAVYTVKFKEALYVLHVFQKKSKTGIKTPQKEIELIDKRLKEVYLIHKEWEEKQKETK